MLPRRGARLSRSDPQCQGFMSRTVAWDCREPKKNSACPTNGDDCCCFELRTVSNELSPVQARRIRLIARARTPTTTRKTPWPRGGPRPGAHEAARRLQQLVELQRASPLIVPGSSRDHPAPDLGVDGLETAWFLSDTTEQASESAGSQSACQAPQAEALLDHRQTKKHPTAPTQRQLQVARYSRQAPPHLSWDPPKKLQTPPTQCQAESPLVCRYVV